MSKKEISEEKQIKNFETAEFVRITKTILSKNSEEKVRIFEFRSDAGYGKSHYMENIFRKKIEQKFGPNSFFFLPLNSESNLENINGSWTFLNSDNKSVLKYVNSEFIEFLKKKKCRR